VPPIGGHVEQGPQHEGAQMGAWMRQNRVRLRAENAVDVDDIEIERAGGVGRAPLPPEPGLDALQDG
jgi:hypothetical protein